jgi:hypothetical protein
MWIVLSVLPVCGWGQEQAVRLESLRPRLVDFVRQAHHGDGAEQAVRVLTALRVVPGEGNPTLDADNPLISPDGDGEWELLHQIGHHVFWAMLPQSLRELYWQPLRCAQGQDESVWEEQAERIYDVFSEASADFFAVTWAAQERLKDGALDPATAEKLDEVMRPQGDGDLSDVQAQVQALCALYADLLASEPAEAWANFHATVVAYSRQSAALPRPARTMDEWLEARQLNGDTLGLRLLDEQALAALQATSASPPEPHLMAYHPVQTLSATVNDSAYDQRARRISAGDQIRTEGGLSLLLPTTSTSILLGPSTAVMFRSTAEVEITRGQAFLTGTGTVSTPVCQLNVADGQLTVRVSHIGETTVGSAGGTVWLIPKAAASTDLPVGSVATVLQDGSLVGPGQADPLQVAYWLPLQPPDPDWTSALANAFPETLPLHTMFGRTASADTVLSSTRKPAELPTIDAWQILQPDAVTEAVLCSDLDGDNRPVGVSATYRANANRIYLALLFNLGASDRRIDIQWRYGDQELTSRTAVASGRRQIVNSLSYGSDRTFAPGDYSVTVSIDGRVAATLPFLVTDD